MLCVCVGAGMYCPKQRLTAAAGLKCDTNILKHPKIPMKGPHLGSLGAGIAQCPDDRITTGGNSSPRSSIITEYCGSHKRILEGNPFLFFPEHSAGGCVAHLCVSGRCVCLTR